MYYLGFDIGGTKCAAVCARYGDGRLTVCRRTSIPTDLNVSAECMLERLMSLADGILEEKPRAIGVSCGGPLDSEQGVILSPPNLAEWDRVQITRILEEHYGVPAYLQNDADACALAEWRFGAGRGTKNMIFITFGTGFGSGLILNGKLYSGTNGNAGEAGHVRLSSDGPVGYGKAGSVEGFCSGGGIAQLAARMARESLDGGKCPSFFREGMTAADLSAKAVADAAREGDECAIEVYRTSGRYLGRALAMLMDILNPECIVIGSIFQRCHDLLWNEAEREILREALPPSRECCRVVPAQLGESIGDYGAITVALYREEIL